MNQPDLGLKVSELRQLKNLTQEQLAEKCEVSTRTIQRIESGEVDPRAYTLQRLGEILKFDFEKHTPTSENLWLTALHLSSAIIMLIIPLVVWSLKKDQSARISTQGRQVLNFQITMTLLLFTAAFLLVSLPVGMVILAETGVTVLEDGPVFLLLACAPRAARTVVLFWLFMASSMPCAPVQTSPATIRSSIILQVSPPAFCEVSMNDRLMSR
jgi:transcriptional regulator with XRE-family HTH domain